MPHGPTPPRPILVLPEEVSAELVLAGLAASTPDPTAGFSSTGSLRGVVQVTGTVGGAVTIDGPAGPALGSVARRLHRWNTEHPMKPAPDAEAARRVLSYTTDQGHATLDLADQPPASELEQWLVAAFDLLEQEIRLH